MSSFNQESVELLALSEETLPTISLSLTCLRLGHHFQMFGHMGASKTYKNVTRSYSGLLCLIGFVHCFLIVLTHHNNKLRPRHKSQIPLEQWQNETVAFRTIHIDCKRSLHPPSNLNFLCILVIDAFSRFLMVYLVTNTGAKISISFVEKGIHSFGIFQAIVHDGGTAFIKNDFINRTKELGIILQPRTAHCFFAKVVKFKYRINTLPVTAEKS